MHIERRLRGLLAASVVAGWAASAAAQGAPLYHVTVLQNLGASACVPTALNDAGVVAGNCSGGGSLEAVAVTWHDGVATALGTLPGGNYSYATAINSLGTVVGDADTGDYRPEGFISTPNGLLNYYPVGGANIRTIGVTDTGVVFGNFTKSLSGNTRAWEVTMFVPEPDRPERFRATTLPKLRGTDKKADTAYAFASNKLGQVVGSVTNDQIGQRGGFWNNDAAHTVVGLPLLPGGADYSFAQAINDLGQAAGQSSTFGTISHAVLWQNDAAHTAIDLGTLPGDTESWAMGLNTAGHVIGLSQVGQTGSASRRAFVYRDGAMHELASQVDPADGTWTIEQVFAINNAGQIVAVGQSGSTAGAILLTPVQP